MPKELFLTGVERTFAPDEIIVSKTDLKGRVTYANRVFLRLADYSEEEILGAPHSVIRHPEMPRCVFKLLWDTVAAGKEIFAYVVNRSRNGDHYWVFAHVTPSFDGTGKIDGYHSNRRVPDMAIVKNTIEPLYKSLLGVEQSENNAKQGLQRSTETLLAALKEKGMSYDEFVFSL